jgi:predicted ArsR family transcriptional regulator
MKGIRMDLEDSLCSKTRIRILKLMLNAGQLNTSQIAKRIGINYVGVLKHLEALEEEGILEMQRFGCRIHYYRYNEHSPKAQAVQTLLEAWKS